jgi:VIT1/CCC1 family predicted Fe2+/Mn2+ transporter
MTETAPAHRATFIPVPEAVGVFDSVETLQQAIYDLYIAGFSRHDISLLAHEDAVREKLGRAWWRSEALEDDPDAPRAAFVSEEWIGELEGYIAGGFFFVGSYVALAALGGPATLAASIAAVAVGGGVSGILGTLLARRVGDRHKAYYAEQVAHGGLLLWVRVRDAARERVAVEILKGHSGRDVHVHDWSEP